MSNVKIEELIKLTESRLSFLTTEYTVAERTGDIARMTVLSQEIAEFNDTVNKLKTVL